MNNPPVPESGEDRLIARYFRPIAQHPGALSLTDDVAVFSPPDGSDLILKTDAIVGGVHFFVDDEAKLVARKALRVNLSDLAAKGSEAAGFLLTLALPDGISDQWLQSFADGLKEDAEAYRCPLMGGDTVKTPGPLTISIAAFGVLPHASMVRRRGARPGDKLFVTGTIGDAALGLMIRREAGGAAKWPLDDKGKQFLVSRYQLPQPRNRIAAVIRRHASAAMDVSDGLAGDLTKLCAASGVSMNLDTTGVPLSEPAKLVLADNPELISTILSGGDDYEIIATVPAEKAELFQRECAAAEIPVSDIGRIIEGEMPPQFLDRRGRPIRLDRLSFSHF